MALRWSSWILFDKTGTLTAGKPAVADVIAAGAAMSAADVLQVAASLDQLSPHVLAGAIVAAGTARGLALQMPTEVSEVHGYGLEGVVGGRRIRLGKAAWIVGNDPPPWARQVRRRAELDGSQTVFVAVDDTPVGALLLVDPIRPDAPRMVRALRAAGITRVVLLTGDRADIAEMVGRVVGVDAALVYLRPAAKLAAGTCESSECTTTWSGDGVNRCSALAAAGRGCGAGRARRNRLLRAADSRSTVDRVDAVADALLIVRRCKGSALQAVVVGTGALSQCPVALRLGLRPPAAGGILEEIIRCALPSAHRVTSGAAPGRYPDNRMPAADVALAHGCRSQH